MLKFWTNCTPWTRKEFPRCELLREFSELNLFWGGFIFPAEYNRLEKLNNLIFILT